MPVCCNVLYNTPETARSAPRGTIELSFCSDCGHLFNAEFDPKKINYTVGYENPLDSSTVFQHYADDLARYLVDRYSLPGKKVVEIGCGNGEFLKRLARLGGCTCTGFDPTFYGEETLREYPEIEIVGDCYSERYGQISGDLLVCRQALEHIDEPGEFLRLVRSSTETSTNVFFEVPNSLYTIRDLGVWDIIYEHYSYFWQGSLERAFQEAGFDVRECYPSFGEQFLCIEARTPESPEKVPNGGWNHDSKVEIYLDTFGKRYRDKVREWSRRLHELSECRCRCVVWGAGSKGVTFLNVVQHSDWVEAIVDMNPNKQERYVAGTGHRVIAPEELGSIRPDLAIVMNPIYEREIADRISSLGVNCNLAVA